VRNSDSFAPVERRKALQHFGVGEVGGAKFGQFAFIFVGVLQCKITGSFCAHKVWDELGQRAKFGVEKRAKRAGPVCSQAS